MQEVHKMASLRIQLRRDTAANWVSNNPILLPGELGIETDSLKFKIGNGSRWNATTSYAFKAGEANGLATLNSSGKIPSSQLPDSISVGGDFAAAIAALTTNSITEGSTNKYFTNQRAIDAVSEAISSAIATETTNRNAAIATQASSTTAAIATAKTQAIAAASDDASAKVIAAKADAVSLSATYTNSAIATEVINRNSAISTAVSGLSSGGGSTGPTGATGPQGLPGDTGPTGAPGTAATITVGSVTTGTPGSSVSVTNSGTTSAAILNFTIPQGATGATGATGSGGGSTFSGNTDAVAEGSTNLYFTNERASAANNTRFTDVYVNINAATDEIMTYVGNNFVTISNLDNRLDGYVMEADADLAGGYAKIGVTSGKILDTVIPSTIARTSDIASQIATVVNGAPATFDTLKEIADYIATDETAGTALTTLVGTKLSSATAASTYAPLASPTFTGTVSGVTKSMVGLGNVDNTTDALKPISTATQSALDAKLAISTASTTYATKASPVFTGTVDFSGATVTGITALPPQINNTGKYLTTDGTSASWATLNLTSYATKASPVFTGTVDFSGATVTGLSTTIADSSITSAKIADGTIVNTDISASASIDKSKIAGTAVTLADTATVTNVMLANNYVGINGQLVSLGSITTIPVGAKTFYNNTGVLPASGMVAGDIYIQVG